MSYCIWVFWLPMNLLLLFVNVIAQRGFLSIDCGGKGNHTAENNITWSSDADYIDVGEIADIGNASEEAYSSYLHTLRFFPKPLKKSCYHLPLSPTVPYLLRTWFVIGNYTGFKQSPSFQLSIETLGMLFSDNITPPYDYPWSDEITFVSSGDVVYVCLIRTSESGDPFINAIELRALREGMYTQANPGTLLLSAYRTDLGGNSTVRYPEDNFDRIWTSNYVFFVSDRHEVRFVGTKEPISNKNSENLPPSVVMQTAVVINSSLFPLFVGAPEGRKSVLFLYFAEIEKLNMWRSFYVMINGENRSEIITMHDTYSTLEQRFDVSNEGNITLLRLQRASNSISSPIINAYESYILVDTQPATYSEDIEHLDAIKSIFGMKGWISDPCYLIPWEGISCANRSSEIRISELDLSGRNVTGTVPAAIGELTALVNVSVANNQLIGDFPDFSKLEMLERLHLQHNNLSGDVPDWLSQLKNLKELYASLLLRIPVQNHNKIISNII